MKTATARDAAEFFVEEIVLRHGAPESVVTDCGKCFIADFTKQVMRLMEVDHRTTTPYHPQANGLVERLNHTLDDMLSMSSISSTPTGMRYYHILHSPTIPADRNRREGRHFS